MHLGSSIAASLGGWKPGVIFPIAARIWSTSGPALNPFQDLRVRPPERAEVRGARSPGDHPADARGSGRAPGGPKKAS